MTARQAVRVRWRLAVTGVVQGVGFRPHVHRLATLHGLSGLVGNDSASVFIEVEGPAVALESFRRDLVDQAPPLAHIDEVTVTEVAATGQSGFVIAASQQADGPVTTAPPDTAPCADCLAEMLDPADRRFGYPFITCTNCGPRFTIITGLPYDRPATTMARFPLCRPCSGEYHDVRDRRFHAQPLACADCGPRVWLESPGVDPTSDAIVAARTLLTDGAIVAIKGVGGFHLACRAGDEEVVATLRLRKRRPGKPFAVMVAGLAEARAVAHVSPDEAELLSSPAAPIVLLHRRQDAPIAASVAPGNPLVGVMLPSSPLHHLLLAIGDGQPLGPLVMTSGNLSEEPLCIDNDEALARLSDIADAWLMHDRPIAVPCDDSVVRVDPTLTMVRRSRGYVPAAIRLPFDGIPALAVGGQLKNTAALTDGRQVWLSPHIGDMGSLATLQAFERTVERFAAMHAVTPARLAADAHPEYTTHRWARTRADGRPVIAVQHHHAHIAAGMVEHGLDGTTPVIGVAFDGTGYGPDDTIWGGEVLLADYDGFRRLAHLSTVPLPGGDAAIRHPRRTALSHLRTAGLAWDTDLPPVAATGPNERDLLAQQLQRGLNCVDTSSMGRLFDAVAALLDVRHDISFEAQAAIELELLAATAEDVGRPATSLRLPLQVRAGQNEPAVLQAAVLIRDIVVAIRAGTDPSLVALGFHHAIASGVAAACQYTRRQADGADSCTVVLSGGVFANALLTRLCRAKLEAAGFAVLTHRLVPPNDGGLALGQVAIAARHQRLRPRMGGQGHRGHQEASGVQ